MGGSRHGSGGRAAAYNIKVTGSIPGVPHLFRIVLILLISNITVHRFEYVCIM